MSSTICVLKSIQAYKLQNICGLAIIRISYEEIDEITEILDTFLVQSNNLQKNRIVFSSEKLYDHLFSETNVPCYFWE